MTGSIFYKKSYTITVLSEEPIVFDDIEDIAYAINEGPCVGAMEEGVSEQLNGKQMAEALVKVGSDPGFFHLDENGDYDEDTP